MSCGIYMITNIKNNKKYIGQSIDIERRWIQHNKNTHLSNSRAYNTSITQAIREWGIENFQFQILEICDKSLLSEKEIYYIELYDTFVNGYNMTLGGEHPSPRIGEANSNAKLKEKDIIYIRTQLSKDNTSFQSTYELFKNRISKRGFQHIWWGSSWVHIMPEIYQDREKLFEDSRAHPYICRRKISAQEYCFILEQKNKGMPRQEVYKQFSHQISLGGFNRYWFEYTEKTK